MFSVAAEAAASGDRAALYGAVALVLTSFIGGGFAYLTSKERGKEQPSPVRYVDPPSSHALPQALSELYEDALERAVLAEATAATWKARAVARGWTEDA